MVYLPTWLGKFSWANYYGIFMDKLLWFLNLHSSEILGDSPLLNLQFLGEVAIIWPDKQYNIYRKSEKEHHRLKSVDRDGTC